jgi:hypothetical protein
MTNRRSVLIAAVLLLLPPTVAAQQTQPQRKLSMSGSILDAGSGAPVHGAVVEFVPSKRYVLTDTAGRFVLGSLKPGPYRVVTSRIGYEDHDTTLVLEAATSIELRMQPNPIALRGITVLQDRFKARRNAAASSVRSFDRLQLLNSGARDAADFVLRRGMFMPIACASSFSQWCAIVRGQRTEISVYIDERPAFGLEELSTYMPHELFLVEVYSGGRHVRAYTNWWVEGMARRGWSLMPLFF